MLLNLKTIYKPATADDAATLLMTPGTYPLYGGVALSRAKKLDIQAGIDLSDLDLAYVRDSENSLRLGSMLTLEQVRQACQERAPESPKLGAVATILAQEMPEAQRNTTRLGDLLIERDPSSPTLTLFLALGGVLKRIDLDMHLTMAAWLSAGPGVMRYLISQIRLPRGTLSSAVAYEKVSRTPADAPIVGAVACVEMSKDGPPHYTTLALCGVASSPIPQPATARLFDETSNIETALNALRLNPPEDHWGSREYRTEMARVLARRALERALAEAKSRA